MCSFVFANNKIQCPKSKMFAVLSTDLTISFKIKDKCLYIDAVARHIFKRDDFEEKTIRDIALDVIKQSEGTKFILDSEFLPELPDILRKYQRAVRIIEKAVLSPHTYIGKKRLLSEFEMLMKCS